MKTPKEAHTKDKKQTEAVGKGDEIPSKLKEIGKRSDIFQRHCLWEMFWAGGICGELE